MKSRVREKSFDEKSFEAKFMQTLFFTSIAARSEAPGVAELNESRGTCNQPFLRLLHRRHLRVQATVKSTSILTKSDVSEALREPTGD